MKKRESLKNIFKEVLNLTTAFFRPYGLQSKLLEIPASVKQLGFRLGFLNFFMTLIALCFAFMLKVTNMLIEYRLILLGVIFFMLYNGQKLVDEALRNLSSSDRQKFLLIMEDEIALRASQIIGKTSGKVFKYDSSNKLYQVMSNESVLNTIKNYLKNLWEEKTQHVFDVFELISIINMLCISILTNNTIPQILFIPLVLIFTFISFFSYAYTNMNRSAYYQKDREYNNKQSLILNDLLRVPVIVKDDLDMRLSKFQETVTASKTNVTKFHHKMRMSYLLVDAVEVFCQYAIIIFYLLGVDWSSISLATIAELSATLHILETALRYTRRFINTLSNHNEVLTVLAQEEKDLSLILDVYYRESEKMSKPKKIDNIKINPFAIQYLEESENDKPFTLASQSPICIKSGETVILYGPSGSGKSTFMKMLTGRIQLEKSTEIPSTSRFLFYDEKLRFGSLTIFEELFCCNPNPDLAKMQEILENLHLWGEIKSNCIDVWQWMREKQFEHTLSNGQRQRLILAKMLYWLNDDIDVLVLDECTSGLDDKAANDSADAEKVLEYIVKYANSDKKRIIVISTHQNINGFKAHLTGEHVFKELIFVREEEANIVKEI